MGSGGRLLNQAREGRYKELVQWGEILADDPTPVGFRVNWSDARTKPLGPTRNCMALFGDSSRSAMLPDWVADSAVADACKTHFGSGFRLIRRIYFDR